MSKDIPWEKLTVGDTFGPLELPFIKRYFTCEMDELNPMHTDASPWGGPVYPAIYMGTLLGLRLIGSRYDSHATVPARLWQRNLNPAPLNKQLFLSGHLADKYIRRGLEYAVIESVMTDENGLDIRQTVDHFLLSLERRTDIQEAKGALDIVRMEDLKSAGEIAPRTRIAYQGRLDDESVFLPDSSHRNDYARTKGYPAALLSGYVLCGYLSDYFEDFFGPSWLTNGEIELAFIKAVHQKQPITIRAAVAEREKQENGNRVVLNFRIEQSDGTANVKGWASGIIQD